MSKMKHLLRKLHLSTDHHHHRPPENSSSQPSPSSSPPPESLNNNPTDTVNGGVDTTAVEFGFFEEEFQVQLAMAISASDPVARNDGFFEFDQIEAAKQLSLACSPPMSHDQRLCEVLSLKYWNYNVIQYDEKVVDGFYDVFAIASNSIATGEMPLLVDLRAVPISDNIEYEAVLVNRSVDFQLQQLENKAYAISVECRVLELGLFMNGLIQRIANLVVDRMGGPVGNAEEILTRWRIRRNKLRCSLNTIVLPLGCLDVGLSRHRALLFKVLADRVNLPCMLVNGSLYTGTDEGAVNLIKFDDGSEYLIDLMGAPGTLIPAEVPSSFLLDSALEARGFSYSGSVVNNVTLGFDKVVGVEATMPDVKTVGVCAQSLKEASSLSMQAKEEAEISVRSGLIDVSEYELNNPVRSEFGLCYTLSSPVEEASLTQERKVKDVSKYVINAAKDPEFAQKLHAVLQESGASPPADLFLNMNSGLLDGQKLVEQIHPWSSEFLCSEALFNPGDYRSKNESSLQCHLLEQPLNSFDDELEQSFCNYVEHQLPLHADVICSTLYSKPSSVDVDLVAVQDNRMIGSIANSSIRVPGQGGRIVNDTEGKVMNQMEAGEETARVETAKEGCLTSCNSLSDSLCHVYFSTVCPMLGEFAEWEIPWEDLLIGERIGIGSYGEVYHADWNGTEVAVKKFLVQDCTPEVLVQFKCEAEMMIRLRHPNVVLFMGAVTSSPNLSILTEFLPRGSLYRLLHRSGIHIDEKQRLKMALDVARGMNCLHTSHPTIVHRDLKSPNLLVDKNWVVKVCDFGLSRLKHHTFLSSNSTAGTPEWMAPEVLRNEPSNEKCDVYSFGVILWELATLCIPWTGLNPMQVVGAVGFQNKRLEIPGEVDPMVAQIIRDCWENDPCLRPSFSQLIVRLKGLQYLVVQRD